MLSEPCVFFKVRMWYRMEIKFVCCDTDDKIEWKFPGGTKEQKGLELVRSSVGFCIAGQRK